jgi:hypothetical protein
MKFLYIFVVLALIGSFSISIFGQSFGQVTWNTFEEKDGLFAIQIPSNWNASELTGTEALAPIDYMFRYNDKGNSFAWIEIMISEPLYSSSRTAAESYMSEYEQFDDYNLLEPISCSAYQLNEEAACSFLSSQQIEGEQRRNVLDIVSISPDDIQTYVVFVASSNIYEPFLPVAEFIIDSLAINSTAVKQVLENQSIENIQSEIPLIPTENDTALQSEIPSISTEDATIEQQTESRDSTTGNAPSASSQTFRSAFDTFVASEPRGFGMYDEKESNTFSPGEDIILYIEPVGFEYGTATDGADKTLYTMDFTADFTISDTEGNVLTGQQGLPVDRIVLPYQEKKLFIPFTITQEEPFPPGNYIITYTIHDTNSGKSFDIVKEIVIS